MLLTVVSYIYFLHTQRGLHHSKECFTCICPHKTFSNACLQFAVNYSPVSLLPSWLLSKSIPKPISCNLHIHHPLLSICLHSQFYQHFANMTTTNALLKQWNNAVSNFLNIPSQTHKKLKIFSSWTFNMKCSTVGFSRPRTVTVRLTSCSYLYLCFCCRGSADGERKTHQS